MQILVHSRSEDQLLILESNPNRGRKPKNKLWAC